jgi:hypothetical protein
MIAFVFLWQAQSARQRLVLGVLAALGFASAAGLSVYVTFAFALFLVSAALYWLARRRFRVVVLYAAVGVLVVLFSGGYLRDLRATEANVVLSAPAQAQPPAHFAKVALRHIPATLVLVLERAVHGNKMATRLLRPFALVLVVFLEFGFFFLAAVRQALSDWRERCLVADVDPAVRELRDIRWLSWLMLGAGLWVALMMRSTVINNNDLAFRGVEVAQFILLIWGAAQLAGAHPETELAAESLQSPMTASAFPSVIRPRVGWLAGCLLLLGLVSTAYQLSILRLYLWGSDRYGWSTLPQSELKNRVGEITQELRAAYAALDRSLPASAKVQFGAAPKLYLQHLFYSRYQHVEGMFPDCGTSFGGSEAVCARLVEQVGPIFGTSALPPTATNSQWQVLSVPTLKTSEQVRALCNDLGIDAIVITGEDPVWNDANAWPSTMKPLYAADFVAAYICR